MVNETESKNKIKVYWDDLPENYSKEIKNRVAAHFSKKYKVPKANVNVVFRAIRKDSEGNTIEISDAGVDNIMDINYQRELMKKWLEINDRKIDFDRLFKLDDKINTDVNFTSSESRHRRWGIKWLEMNNFLCFGQDNHVNFGRFQGLNLVNSEPENQGGKTTFNIDTIKFLLFGNTTKTEKNEQIFNTFSQENELSVRGELLFNPHNIVIERKMTRKEKRDGEWSVSNKVRYYQVMPDGSHEELNDEDATATTKLITLAVGKEDDFDITTLSTANNLEDLIEMKPAMNGKLLNRFIGLEIIDDKLAAVRKRYNEFNSKKMGNLYNVITLKDEIESLETNTETLNDLLESHDETLKESVIKIKTLNDEKDVLMSGKVRIDDELLRVNTETLEVTKNEITTKGLTKKREIEELKQQILGLGVIDFDEDKHLELTNTKNKNDGELRNISSDIIRCNKDKENLISGENCVTCKRPLDDVDNSQDIIALNAKVVELTARQVTLNKENEGLSIELAKLAEIKLNADKKDKLEVSIDKLDVQLGSLRNELTETKNLIKKYQINKDSIDTNKEIDRQVEHVKVKIKVEETTKENTTEKMNKIRIELATIAKDIKTKNVQIVKINGEEEVERIFKIYIDMYGKKGIGKMVLKSVLPIINSELVRLMEDVCNFNVELDINSKNDVDYIMVMDGVRKSLKSGSGLEKTIASLALRAVLGKMAYLPMPNFITFDEVLGKVAPVNIVKLEEIFNKIKELYDMVFLITHNPIVKDWADQIITIKKDEVTNISSINLK